MAKLKIAALPENRLVKVTLELPASVWGGSKRLTSTDVRDERAQ
jgi:hypothetical protein